ncbi:hypothetical protein [Mesorhizobium sp. CN2-181]|uniref:hypothetical protein n=1 Tax=Mesorhizobium yinganensis TaxID=3157707 RepID=UPI0032B7A488
MLAMDWNAAIEKNREALKRILAMLVAITGLAAGALGAEGQFTLFPQRGAAASRRARAEKSKLSPALTLPRRLHRAALRLLHPAEAATRRLIIVAARGLAVTLPPLRPRKAKPKSNAPLLRGFGIAVTMSRADLARAAAASRAAALRAARPKRFSLPLLDPLHNPFRVRRRYVPAHAGPRILFPGVAEPFHLPAPPSPRDPIDATRLALRLQALAAALGDLPGQAKRFARWHARRAAGRNGETSGMAEKTGGGDAAASKRGRAAVRFHRRYPLKPGRPPGWQRKPTHDVHEVLDVVHGLALNADIRIMPTSTQMSRKWSPPAHGSRHNQRDSSKATDASLHRRRQASDTMRAHNASQDEYG